MHIDYASLLSISIILSIYSIFIFITHKILYYIRYYNKFIKIGWSNIRKIEFIDIVDFNTWSHTITVSEGPRAKHPYALFYVDMGNGNTAHIITNSKVWIHVCYHPRDVTIKYYHPHGGALRPYFKLSTRDLDKIKEQLTWGQK